MTFKSISGIVVSCNNCAYTYDEEDLGQQLFDTDVEAEKAVIDAGWEWAERVDPNVKWMLCGPCVEEGVDNDELTPTGYADGPKYRYQRWGETTD